MPVVSAEAAGRVRVGCFVILETKGFDEREEIKRAAAVRWLRAVNAEGSFGKWEFALARSIPEVGRALDALGGAEVDSSVGAS